MQLLRRGASEEAAAALFEASGAPPRPLWEMFDFAPSAAEVRAAVEAEPGAAAQRFGRSHSTSPTLTL